jgi:hypothetical protein
MALTQRTAEGESCREWTVDNAYTVCLSLNDHLPRDFKARDGSVFAASQTETRKSLSSRPNIEQFVPRVPRPNLFDYQGNGSFGSLNNS